MTFKSCLTDEDTARIEGMAEASLLAGGRPSPVTIARAIGRTRNQVAWYLYRNGLRLRAEPQTQPPATSWRNGVLLRRFTPAEDALMLEMRLGGGTPTAIAAAILTRFGIVRRPSAVRTRLILLACFEAAAETVEAAAAIPCPRAASQRGAPR